MNSMRIVTAGATLALTALATTSVSATERYNWTFYDNTSDLVASGTLTVGAPTVDVLSGVGAETVYPVVSATGTTTGIDGFTAESISLYGGQIEPVGYYGVGNQTYDNAIFAVHPYIDGNGLEFVGGTSGNDYNIYNNVNTGYYQPGNYPNGDVVWNNVGVTNNGTFSITAVPEPACWVMMLAGFGFAGAALRARRSTAGAYV